jgi:hypothetical protein
LKLPVPPLTDLRKRERILPLQRLELTKLLGNQPWAEVVDLLPNLKPERLLIENTPYRNVSDTFSTRRSTEPPGTVTLVGSLYALLGCGDGKSATLVRLVQGRTI